MQPWQSGATITVSFLRPDPKLTIFSQNAFFSIEIPKYLLKVLEDTLIKNQKISAFSLGAILTSPNMFGKIHSFNWNFKIFAKITKKLKNIQDRMESNFYNFRDEKTSSNKPKFQITASLLELASQVFDNWAPL